MLKLKLIPCFVLSFFLSTCGSKGKELYVLEELRVPLIQTFMEITNPSPVASCTTDSRKVLEKNYAQQYPLRPGKKILLKTVSISPPSDFQSISITKIESFRNPLAKKSSVSVASVNAIYAEENLANFSIRKDDCLSYVKQESPMQIREDVFELTLPSTEEWIKLFKLSPAITGYKISYKAEAKSRIDNGFITVYFLPDPSDVIEWKKVETSLTDVTPDILQALKLNGRSNTPPILNALSPSPQTMASFTASESQEIAVNFLTTDPDMGSKQRFQWFVTNGALSNPYSINPQWTPDKSGEVGIFVSVRDLQGGTAYLYGNYQVK